MLHIPSIVRINGVLPDLSTLGDKEKSERAAEVERTGMSTNTSCSVFVSNNTTEANQEILHLLIDAGEGVAKSLEKIDLSYSHHNVDSIISKFYKDRVVNMPDAVLITHSHSDHIKDLPLIAAKYFERKSEALKVYCTRECHEQLNNKFSDLSSKTNGNNRISFTVIRPNELFKVGPISVTPISAYHGDSAPEGSVIYILRLPDNKKVIIGWDFLSLPDDIDQNQFWNPDLVILGTQTYNPHPETGLISVSDSFELVRRWNAKECYIVHYRGLRDFEDAKNQWFRGPTKAMNSEELQKTIDENLRVTGKEGKYKIIVAKEGMVWTARKGEDEGEGEKQDQQQSSQVSSPIGMVLEIESLQDYVLTFEKETKDGNMLKLIIEDRINRYDLRFINPQLDKSNDNILYAQGEKGMFATGAEVSMEILPAESLEKKENSIVRIHVFKKKKTVFKDDIMISRRDTDRLRRYIRENF
ncbi:MAG: MBL fold metallo-hydrolase [Thermoproteota archaeon]|nr:MBL fold metallo-hydrolase [Thermoproteota archaeon]